MIKTPVNTTQYIALNYTATMVSPVNDKEVKRIVIGNSMRKYIM